MRSNSAPKGSLTGFNANLEEIILTGPLDKFKKSEYFLKLFISEKGEHTSKDKELNPKLTEIVWDSWPSVILVPILRCTHEDRASSSEAIQSLEGP
ncbi:hypothetical protein AMATHDRAFT_10022 [Amanita thiersii Skay4041]|uniref:Uncharacterized protein n=1 Tax=Amanita thiersii Skay4041 TaxID=703135 RepID=A0A2A9NA34_9AGAR|nr:hypothetical protein AMATHDRAFT_10022 [Amanita thiersii Skay4041]